VASLGHTEGATRREQVATCGVASLGSPDGVARWHGR
jgi:hypothetical protein